MYRPSDGLHGGPRARRRSARRRALRLTLLGAVLAAAGCQGGPATRMAWHAGATAPAQESTLDLAASGAGRAGYASRDLAEAPAEDAAVPISTSTEDGGDGRLRVYSARLALQVAAPGPALAAFVTGVESLGGYLEERADVVARCRVPAARFNEALHLLRTLGRVTSEHVSSEDVTRAHRDLTIRIANARKARDRLLALLERAEEVKDILAIESQLRRLTEEIEQLEADLAALSSRIAYSVVEARFRDLPTADRTHPPVRFEWLQRVGVEPLLEDF